MGREFVRMSLGGVRDEAEIRGHRRTYIGALPGRLVRALRDAGTMNPVILLDEVDKVGADWRGDPSAALLEVLDPAQNSTFRDHYLDVELDLSEVVFIATANQAETIPGPLLDRMEVIRFDGYTVAEKVGDRPRLPVAAPARAQRPARGRGRVERRASCRPSSPSTRARPASASSSASSGRCCARPRRRSPRGRRRRRSTVDLDAGARRARAPEGLPGGRGAHRGARRGHRPGGHRHRRRRAVRRGQRDERARTGGLTLTGQLGDVMKESAQIALTYVRAHAGELGIPDDAFDDREFHVHVPAGAIPKDGPSAGVTMTTALASLLTGRPVKHTVGMTGEVTLQGRVLPIGGLKQKVLAAHAAGLTDVILPERNRGDLDDVPADVREPMTFHPVMTVGEVLDIALEPAPHGPVGRPGAQHLDRRGGGPLGSPPRRYARAVADVLRLPLCQEMSPCASCAITPPTCSGASKRASACV